MAGCGHGWVFNEPGGVKARCGGPSICRLCAVDAARIGFSFLTGTAEHPGPMHHVIVAEPEWKATAELRWYRRPGGSDWEARLQQRWKRGDETEWREVPVVLAD